MKEKETIEYYKKKAEEYMAGWQRAKADYLNLKKESQKEKEELFKYSNATLIIDILPIYDHLKLSFAHLPKDLEKNEWVEGVRSIKKQMSDFLENLGIKEIETVGREFNPEYHEAIVHEKKEGKKSNIIFEEVKPGYLIQDKVLYPAKVKVAK